MSAIIETFLLCDGGCGENFGVDDRGRSAAHHRRQARKDGWKFRRSKDFCPNCAAKPKAYPARTEGGK